MKFSQNLAVRISIYLMTDWQEVKKFYFVGAVIVYFTDWKQRVQFPSPYETSAAGTNWTWTLTRSPGLSWPEDGIISNGFTSASNGTGFDRASPDLQAVCI